MANGDDIYGQFLTGEVPFPQPSPIPILPSELPPIAPGEPDSTSLGLDESKPLAMPPIPAATTPNVPASQPPGAIRQFGRDLLRGIDILQQTGYGLVAAGADVAGAEKVRQWALEGYQRNKEEIEANPGAIGTYKNIHDLGDLGAYAVEKIAENLPMMLPSLFTGGVAGLAGKEIGRRVGIKMVEGMTERLVAQGVAKATAEAAVAKFVANAAKTGLALGSVAGAYPSSAGLESGQIYPDILEKTGQRRPGLAFGYGAVAGALDVIEPVVALRRIMGPLAKPAIDQFLGGIVKRVGVEAAKQFAIEATTEGLQSIIENKAVSAADGRKLWTQETLDDAIESFLAGGFAGGGIGTASQAAQEARAALAPAVKEPLTPPPPQPREGRAAIAPETIVAAASRLGQVVETGPLHHLAETKLRARLGIALEDPRVEDIEHGFTTSTGRFVDREAAYRIADKAKQLKPRPQDVGFLSIDDLKGQPPPPPRTEVPRATTIPSDKTVLPAPGQVPAQGQGVSGPNLEQTLPRPGVGTAPPETAAQVTPPPEIKREGRAAVAPTTIYYSAQRTVGDVKESPSLGTYWTTDYEAAKQYAGTGGTVQSAQIQLEKPLVITPNAELAASGEPLRDVFSLKEINRQFQNAGVRFRFEDGEEQEFWRWLDDGGRDLAKAIRRAGYDGIDYPDAIGYRDFTTRLVIAQTLAPGGTRTGMAAVAPKTRFARYINMLRRPVAELEEMAKRGLEHKGTDLVMARRVLEGTRPLSYIEPGEISERAAKQFVLEHKDILATATIEDDQNPYLNNYTFVYRKENKADALQRIDDLAAARRTPAWEYLHGAILGYPEEAIALYMFADPNFPEVGQEAYSNAMSYFRPLLTQAAPEGRAAVAPEAPEARARVEPTVVATPQRLPTESVQRVVDEVRARYPNLPVIRIIDDPNFREPTGELRAGYTNEDGSVTLNLAGLQSEEHARRVLAEENWHWASEQLEDFNRIIDGLGTRVTDEQLRAEVPEYSQNLADPARRRNAVIEYAYRRGLRQPSTMWARVWQAIADAIYRVFGVRFGEADIRALLNKSEQVLRGDGRVRLVPRAVPREGRAAVVHQVFGQPTGAPYQPERIAPIIEALGNANLDPVQWQQTPERIDQAWEWATNLVDPMTRQLALEPLLAAVPQDMTPSVFRSQLWTFAVRLAATGDIGLMRWMAATHQEAILGETLTPTTAGRGLRGLAIGADDPLFQIAVAMARETRRAAGEHLGTGDERLNAIIAELADAAAEIDTPSVEGDLGSVQATLNAPTATSEAELEAQLNQLLFPSQAPPEPPALEQAIMAHFPLMGMRSFLEKDISEELVKTWWQLLEPPKGVTEGPLWTAQKILRRELGIMLREALKAVGLEKPTGPPKITDEQKFATILGKEQLKQGVITQIQALDTEVRSQIGRRRTAELVEVESQEDIDAINQKYQQILDAWEEANTSWLNDVASQSLLRRLVRRKVKAMAVDWKAVFDTNQDEAALQTAVLDAIRTDINAASSAGMDPAFTPLDLTRTMEALGTIFENVLELERNRWEMNQIAARAREALRLTRTPEAQAEAIVEQYAREQSDTPDARRLTTNEVREAFKRYLAGGFPTVEEFRATLETLNISELSITGLIHVADRELAARRYLARIKEQERQRAALRREQAQIADQAQTTAATALKRLEQDYAGTEWLTGPPDARTAIRKRLLAILSDFYQSVRAPPEPGEVRVRQTRAELEQRLREANVQPETARRLAEIADQKRETDWANARVRAQQRAAEGYRIKQLMDELLATPLLARDNPAWVHRVAVDWFLAAGLPRDQAEAAARTFQESFRRRLAEAGERLAQKIISRERHIRNPEEFIAALRASLLDPTKDWVSEFGRGAGLEVPTPEQSRQLAELDLQLSNPELDLTQRKEVMAKMHAIYLKLKLPPGLATTIAAQFVATHLTGFRTFTVNLEAPAAEEVWERMMASLAAVATGRFGDIAPLWKSMVNAWRGLWQSWKYGMSTDAFIFGENEFREGGDELKRVWLAGARDIESRQPIRMAKGLGKCLYGAQQFVMRNLNAIDQAHMIAKRQMQMTLYGIEAFRMVGLGTQDINNLVDACADLKRAAFEEASRQGMDVKRATTYANYVVNEQLQEMIAGALTPAVGEIQAQTLAQQVANAAEADAYLVTGRVPDQDQAETGGWLSGPMMGLVKLSNYMRQQGGAWPVAAVAIFGYLTVPLRTARFYAWYSPLGLLRVYAHKFRTRGGRIGRPEMWRQSLGNELQVRHRLKTAWAATIVQGMLLGGAGLALYGLSSEGEDERRKKKLRFYFTGRGPRGKEMRDAWLKAGFQENAIVMDYGGKRAVIPMNRAGEVLAHVLWPLSAVDDYEWRKKEAEAKGVPFTEAPAKTAGFAIMSYASLLGQRGLGLTLSNWARIASGEGGFERAVAGLGSSVLAGAVTPFLGLQRSVLAMFEGPVDRSSISSLMLANAPVLGIAGDSILKAQVNRFGDRLGDRTWFGRLAQTGIPIAFRVDTDAGLFYEQMANLGIAPPVLRRYVLEERYGPLSNDQYAQFAATSGARIKEAIGTEMGSLAGMTPENRAARVLKITRAADERTATDLGLERVTPLRERAPTGLVAIPMPRASAPAYARPTGRTSARLRRPAGTRAPRTQKPRTPKLPAARRIRFKLPGVPRARKVRVGARRRRIRQTVYA